MNSVFAKQRWKNSIENVQTITAPRFTVTYSARPHKHVMSLSHIWTRTYYIVMMTIQSMSFSDVITKSERWWRLWQKQSLTGHTYTHMAISPPMSKHTQGHTVTHSKTGRQQEVSCKAQKKVLPLPHKGVMFFCFFYKGVSWRLKSTQSEL